MQEGRGTTAQLARLPLKDIAGHRSEEKDGAPPSPLSNVASVATGLTSHTDTKRVHLSKRVAKSNVSAEASVLERQERKKRIEGRRRPPLPGSVPPQPYSLRSHDPEEASALRFPPAPLPLSLQETSELSMQPRGGGGKGLGRSPSLLMPRKTEASPASAVRRSASSTLPVSSPTQDTSVANIFRVPLPKARDGTLRPLTALSEDQTLTTGEETATLGHPSFDFSMSSSSLLQPILQESEAEDPVKVLARQRVESLLRAAGVGMEEGPGQGGGGLAIQVPHTPHQSMHTLPRIDEVRECV